MERASDQSARSAVNDLDIELAMEVARRQAAVFVRDPDERDRLAAEAASRAWEHQRRYDPRRGSLDQWIFGLVRNIAREWRRDRARGESLRGRLLRVPRDAASHMQHTDELADLRSAFGRLAEREQHLIYLRYWCDLPYREIGQRVGLSEAACRQVVRRALIRLGRIL